MFQGNLLGSYRLIDKDKVGYGAFLAPSSKISMLAYVLGMTLKLKKMEEFVFLTFTLVA